MEYFVSEFKKIENLYIGLNDRVLPESEIKFHEILDFMYSFSNSLPDERAIYKQNLAKILTYGLTDTGANHVIKSFQEKISQFKNIGATRINKFL